MQNFHAELEATTLSRLLVVMSFFGLFSAFGEQNHHVNAEATPQSIYIRGRPRPEMFLALSIVAVGAFLMIKYQMQLWTTGPEGLSLLSHKLPYWDFSNLWGGSVIAMRGEAQSLFDVAAYREDLRQMFTPLLPNQEWSYPPSIVLIGAPFASLPIFPAYLAWQLTTVAALFYSLKPLRFPLWARIGIIMSPSVCLNAIFGQNGSLTAALLLGGLACLPKRPLLAGFLFGVLTIKPQFGILVPICIFASGRYRAIWSAIATGLALFLATSFFFGFDVWQGFWKETRPLMTAIMEAPFPQSYQSNAMTMFATARSLGANLDVAYLVQGTVTLGCMVAAYLLWKGNHQGSHARRVCLTGILALVATPYGYYYDCVPLVVATVFLFKNRPRIPIAIIAFLYMYPFFAHFFNNNGYFIGPLVIGSVAALLATEFHSHWRSSTSSAATEGSVSPKSRSDFISPAPQP